LSQTATANAAKSSRTLEPTPDATQTFLAVRAEQTPSGTPKKATKTAPKATPKPGNKNTPGPGQQVLALPSRKVFVFRMAIGGILGLISILTGGWFLFLRRIK
jgi:hypothetical protein